MGRKWTSPNMPYSCARLEPLPLTTSRTPSPPRMWSESYKDHTWSVAVVWTLVISRVQNVPVLIVWVGVEPQRFPPWTKALTPSQSPKPEAPNLKPNFPPSKGTCSWLSNHINLLNPVMLRVALSPTCGVLENLNVVPVQSTITVR